MKDLFGKTGQMLLIGLMLFCTGTMIKPHDFVDVFKRGFWLLLARLLPAYLFAQLYGLLVDLKVFVELILLPLHVL